ncbi:hypothetical protein Pyn_40599 [Prunus yedoensis var. nudiflora]|uniref:Uncharacterized protein n=1 Tax=Prunus yedoensis var. nudiflora TaxID=2094558 RepID=A0A314YF71_PRUYE|nr:hypothetical protein Pyn_40599 [Prunus yedoensis var. nudiflora]
MMRRLRVMGIPEGPVADDTETNSRSLYICTYESKTGHAHYDIRAIRLSDLLSTFKSKSKIELLRKLASVEGEDVPYLMGCGLLGSQILLAGGLEPRDPKQKTGFRYGPSGSKQIYLFETDDDGKIKEELVYNHGRSHSHSHTPSDEGEFGGIIKGDCCYGELHQGKPEPLVVEVGGKLYVLSGGPRCFSKSPVFEEFNLGTWTTLPDPPYIRPCPRAFRYFSYAIVGTKIMVSTPITPAFCFNVAAPNPRQWWVCSAEPFPFLGLALVVDLEEEGSDLKCNKIMFGYERIPGYGHGYDVVAYAMFHDDENGYCYYHRIQPLHLLTEFHALLGRSHDTFRFVHLGGRKVCFVIASFIPGLEADDDHPIPTTEKMNLVVVAFEFSISKNDGSTRSFSAEILSSCVFPFDWASESGRTFDGKLLGCFVR